MNTFDHILLEASADRTNGTDATPETIKPMEAAVSMRH